MNAEIEDLLIALWIASIIDEDQRDEITTHINACIDERAKQEQKVEEEFHQREGR